MTPERLQRVEALFDAVAELAPAERAALLARECGADLELRREVESLLAHDETPRQTRGLVNPSEMRAVVEGLRQLAISSTRGDGALGPGEAAPVVIPQEDLRLPCRLGRYTLQAEIGRGGMGVVYRGEQENPRRTVAIKLMRPGVWSRRAQKRFEYEAQVLARLRHHGIAQIYEADVAVDPQTAGVHRYYFAMELIEGRPLLAYANDRGLGTRERLALFAKVCDAIQHAHQNGVIHRDLKSTNVLVTAEGEPKVLDFGVARALDAESRLTTMGTDVGQLIGTLPYMSPEQVGGDPDAVDTRSDVYALGVNLYELLTGRLPHDVERRSLADAARVIRDETPPRLSTLNRVFRGDVDTIVHKALEKEPDRRYASAADLGADVRRYLAGEPIAAKRDSGWYLLSKAVVRYRVALIVACLFLVTVSGAAVWLGFLYQRSRTQGLELEMLYRRADAARNQAEVARRHEQEARREAEAIGAFFTSSLEAADPRYARRPDLSMREFLDQTAAKVDEGALGEHPDARALIRDSISSAYAALGRYAESESQARAALAARRESRGADSVEAAGAALRLSEALIYRGALDEAETLLNDALQVLRTRLGSEHLDVARALTNLATLEIDRRRFEPAERYASEALRIRRQQVAADDTRLTISLNQLGLIARNRREFAAARAHYHEALAILRQARAADAPDYASIMNNLGLAYAYDEDFASAEPLFEEALAMNRRLFGEPHPSVANTLNSLGGVYQARGDFAAAEDAYRRALEQRSAAFGPQHPVTLGAAMNLALCLDRQGRPAEAEPLLRANLAAVQVARANEPLAIADAQAALGMVLAHQGRFGEALELAEDCLRLRSEAAHGTWQHGAAQSLLGEVLTGLERYEEAEPLLRSGWEQMQAAEGVNNLARRVALTRLVDHYRARGDQAVAAEWAARLAEVPEYGSRRVAEPGPAASQAAEVQSAAESPAPDSRPAPPAPEAASAEGGSRPAD